MITVASLHAAPDAADRANARALDFLSDGKSREAVAVLADSARRHPENRKTGALLYSLLRDKHWPVAQTLPVKMPAAVTVLDFSTDSSLVIAGAKDGTVRVIDVESGEFTGATIKHPGSIIGVKIAPGNEYAFSVGAAGVAHIWDLATGKVIRRWQAKGKKISASATNDDLSLVALGYEDGDAIVYSRRTGGPLGEPIHHTRAVTSLVFSRDGQSLAAASADGTARVWDLGTMKPRDFTVKHKSPLTNVDLGRLGILLLTSSKDGIAKVTDATNGAPIISDVDCGAPIRDARLGASGIRFLTVLADHTVRIWDSYTGEPVEGVIRTDDGIASADWSGTGLRIITGSDGPRVHLWRMRDGERLCEGMLHESPVPIVAAGPLGKFVATGCTNGEVRIWRQDIGATANPLPTVRKHHGPVRTALYSRDGEGLVSAGEDFTAIRWDLDSPKPHGRALPHGAPVACAIYNPDRSLVGTVSEDGKASLFNGETGEMVGEPRELGAPGRWISFHDNGRFFVTAAGTKATVWSADQGGAVGAPIEHPGDGERDLHVARFSPDGKWIVTASADGTARVWETTTHNAVATLKKHEGPVLNARFSFDGKLLVTTGADGAVIVWDTATWQPNDAPIVMPGEVWSAVITPDNQFVLATSLLSRGVRIFEIATGRPFTDGIELPTDAVSVDIHPSGETIVVASADGSVRSYGSPFGQEDVPRWMPDFAERLIGMRLDEAGKFVLVKSEYQQLKNYLGAGARGANADFPRLARWLVSPGAQRTGMPRTQATIADSVVQRVQERSLEALYECYESAPSDPLILAAMSLYVPTKRQGEFLAEFALKQADDNPLAQAFCASAFAKYGRMEEAERVMKAALDAAPDDYRVLRRAAKLDARQGRKDEAIAKFERAVADDPDDAETRRGYGWALYNLGVPAKALEQFRKGNELSGGGDQDIAAGLCLAAAATGDEPTAIAQYRRLVKLATEWAEADYVKNLGGWTEKELGEMERIRALAVATR